jgi:hypothetical protein
MNDILENIPLEALTEDQKNQITSAFNEQVELKATEIAADEIALKEAELKENYEKELQNFKNFVDSKIEQFIDEAVEDIVSKIDSKLIESIDCAQNNLVIEAFQTMIEATGAKILENSETPDQKYSELAEKYDSQRDKIIELENKVKTLEKEKAISEAASDLSVLEADKFVKLANLIDLNESIDEKLAKLKSEVKGKVEKVENLDESVKDDSKKAEPAYKRFL